MRKLLIAAGAAAAFLPLSAASAQYYGHGYYDREVAREQRECRRELRRADTRREYRRELRECRREIREAVRDSRWERRRGHGYGYYGRPVRAWDHPQRGGYYWDGYRWRSRW